MSFFTVRKVVAHLKMSDIEERTNIKFCVLLQESPAETLNMLWKANGDRAMENVSGFVSGIKASMMDARSLTMTLVVVSISVNK